MFVHIIKRYFYIFIISPFTLLDSSQHAVWKHSNTIFDWTCIILDLKYAVSIYSTGLLPPHVPPQNIYGEHQKPKFILSCIHKLFSSVHSLNEAFFQGDSLDILAIQEFYTILFSLKPIQPFTTCLTQCFSTLLSKLTIVLPDISSRPPSYLNQLIIILECPLFDAHDRKDDLSKQLCLVMHGLRSKSYRILAKHYSVEMIFVMTRNKNLND